MVVVDRINDFHFPLQKIIFSIFDNHFIPFFMIMADDAIWLRLFLFVINTFDC